MITTVVLNADSINGLDLSPAIAILDPWLQSDQLQKAEVEGDRPFLTLRFEVNYPRDPADPRELSEIPEIRLWFVRLDARYPWLPLVLDWEAGELGRYAAMLVPHQFSPTEGIQYNPESLEIFVMGKVFVLIEWMRKHGIFSRNKVKFMTQMLGYELDDAFFDFVGA